MPPVSIVLRIVLSIVSHCSCHCFPLFFSLFPLFLRRRLFSQPRKALHCNWRTFSIVNRLYFFQAPFPTARGKFWSTSDFNIRPVRGLENRNALVHMRAPDARATPSRFPIFVQVYA